jgi:serine/threonine protein kinase
MKFDRYDVMCREDGSMFRLGQGKTSSSYKALDLDLQVPVVLKVIRQEFLEDEQARKRFLREARAAALLRHPNVAMIYRLGEEDGTCFYAREFIERETLDAKVNRDGPLAVTEALNVALQVAQALVAVKKMNLVHRDIKPSNLMIAQDGAIKIIDFGLTKK